MKRQVCTSGNFKYYLQKDGSAKVKDFDSSEELPFRLVVPEELDGHPVTAIGDHAFSVCNMESVVLPNSVERVVGNPFYRCKNLVCIEVSPNHPTLEVMDGALVNKIEKRLICYPIGREAAEYAVPEGVVHIGEDAFAHSEHLRRIVLPDSVTEIECKAFFLCEKLKNIVLSNSLTIIGKSAFWFCMQLESVVLPNSLKRLGDWALQGCTRLTSIALPDATVSLGENPISGCENLVHIEVSPNHPTLKVVDGVLLDKEGKRLICYPMGREAAEYAVPEGVERIGWGAFSKGTWLKRIVLPDSVKEIDEFALYGILSLERLNLPDSVERIDTRAISRKGEMGEDDSVYHLVVTVHPGSAAEQYCREMELNYRYEDAAQ